MIAVLISHAAGVMEKKNRHLMGEAWQLDTFTLIFIQEKLDVKLISCAALIAGDL